MTETEIIAECNALTEALGLDKLNLSEETHKHKELSKILSDLKAQKKVADKAAEDEEFENELKEETAAEAGLKAKEKAIADKKAAAEKEEEEKKPFPFSVAKGKSLSTKNGIKDPGQEVVAGDFGKDKANGKEVLADLVKKKFVIKA